MASLARLVVPGLPHHVTQRGNGRQRSFFADADYALCRDLVAELGEPDFLRPIERKTGRDLMPGKRGPKPKRHTGN